MKILINCSSLKVGGGLQVALSLLLEWRTNFSHNFVIVLSQALELQLAKESFPPNFTFYVYDMKPGIIKILSGKDRILSGIEKANKIDVVLTVFGPAYWKPNARHIVGFARGHYVYPESPFFNLLSTRQSISWKIKKFLHLIDFSKNNDCLITENFDVTCRLKVKLKKEDVYTISNFYHQVFDQRENWDTRLELPAFDGFTLLTVSANYLHKNLNIIPQVISVLIQKYPKIKVRFVITVEPEVFSFVKDPAIMERIVAIGSIKVEQCPFLYTQVDAAFLPTLLESFSANYPEAMRMDKPVLTSRLNFATGLCKDAAIYFNPLDPEDIADSIIKVATNKNLQGELIRKGRNQLRSFDSYSERASKYLEVLTQNN